jgi:quercetin dioxygenase-like cupin family protein
MINKKNEIMNLIDLCDYQKNSIVSQTVINKKSGTVTFFAFDEGQGLSEHKAPYDALVIIIDGEAEITIESNLNILKKGEMIIMPENKPHALYAKKRFKMILTLIGK